MKKIILSLLICGSTFTLFAQEMSDSAQSKTKIKNNKAKTKDENGKMKVKDNGDMNSTGDAKTKIKDDKIKIKDADGKVKVKGEGNMNSGTENSGMMNGSMNTSTNTNVLIINGWKTDPANLPVVGNGVTPDVVTNLKNKYGTNIYDIKQIRSTSGQNIYVVRVMENGGMRTDYVGADGNAVSQ